MQQVPSDIRISFKNVFLVYSTGGSISGKSTLIGVYYQGKSHKMGHLGTWFDCPGRLIFVLDNKFNKFSLS